MKHVDDSKIEGGKKAQRENSTPHASKGASKPNQLLKHRNPCMYSLYTPKKTMKLINTTDLNCPLQFSSIYCRTSKRTREKRKLEVGKEIHFSNRRRRGEDPSVPNLLLRTTEPTKNNRYLVSSLKLEGLITINLMIR